MFFRLYIRYLCKLIIRLPRTKKISFIRGVKILTSSSKNFSISFWLSVKYWTGFCVIARRPMKSLNTSVPWHVYIGFWQNINKSLPHVQTFHRVSFGILFCGKNHLPRICTFLSKTQPCSNSGERSNKIPCQVFFVNSHRREEGPWLLWSSGDSYSWCSPWCLDITSRHWAHPRR